MRIKPIAILALIVSLPLQSIFAQEIRISQLFDYDAKVKRTVEVIYPSSIEGFLFRSDDITRYRYDPIKFYRASYGKEFSRVKFHGIRDFKPPCGNGVIKERNRSVVSRCFESHPSFFSAVEIDNKLYVFGREDERENLDVFNAFVKNLHLSIKDETEARDVIDLFVFLNSYRFGLPKSEILEGIDTIPEIFRRGKQKQIEDLKEMIKPVNIGLNGNQHVATFFMWEPKLGNVRKWVITISGAGILSGVVTEIGKI